MRPLRIIGPEGELVAIAEIERYAAENIDAAD